ncbi:outer membrane protein Iml2/Tetratricopeptide repeat protein 39 [Lipomyces japonicus]|uniref:outer membrane protein Iml2/Tetratricopeptide repeat protein 39 n=1 Tax=Lipomyces japonicus TaxID=56871 RepID=UPI0034CD744B
MVKPAAWLRGKSGSALSGKSESSKSLNTLDEKVTLQKALEAMDCIMADDLKQASSILNDLSPNSSFCSLATGVVVFIEATLGFEADAIRDATEKLQKAESLATRDRIRAQKFSYQSSSYAAGTEYYVAIAESHLMAAVVLFLSESAIASVKSFYKLRRAYQILSEIYHHAVDGTHVTNSTTDQPDALSDEKEDLMNIDDQLQLDAQLEALQLEMSVDQNERERNSSDFADIEQNNLPPQPAQKVIPFGQKPGGSEVDDYIQSGVNLCFGILQLVISMIPPALGKILSIIGFRGDRDTSIQMLWAATASDNIHGALATLTLLLYYTGPAQVCDIETEEGSYPKERLLAELAKTRKKYPKSALWLLQEARMQGMNGELRKSLETLETPLNIQMRQVEALVAFEKAMCYLDLHDFEPAAHTFIKLTHLNSWSHALYTYVAGVCYVELYRTAIRSGIPDSFKVAKYKSKAEELLLLAPTMIGKRKLSGKPMPVELYLQRKIQKWQVRLPKSAKKKLDEDPKASKPSIVDNVGSSPVNEIMYFWNGYKRMPRDALQKSLQELNFFYTPTPDKVTALNLPSSNSAHFEIESQTKPFLKDIDEQGTRALLLSIVLRDLGHADQGVKLLTSEVLPITRADVKGNYKENWIPPSALYERGVFEWFSKGKTGASTTREWVTKSAQYGHEYDLDTRIGVRVQTALEILKEVEGSS